MPKKLVPLGVGLVLLFGIALVFAYPPTAGAEMGAEETMADADAEMDADKSLYERLGGSYAIAAVVDDLIERLAANEALNENPGIGSARKPERFPGLKYHLTGMVCMATGGPCTYTGKSMKDAHIDMGITASDWELFAADCTTTLNKFKVPEAEQQELFDIIGSTMGDIVVADPS